MKKINDKIKFQKHKKYKRLFIKTIKFILNKFY